MFTFVDEKRYVVYFGSMGADARGSVWLNGKHIIPRGKLSRLLEKYVNNYGSLKYELVDGWAMSNADPENPWMFVWAENGLRKLIKFREVAG